MFALREQATNRMRFSRSQSPGRNVLAASLSPLSSTSSHSLTMTMLPSPVIASLQFPSSGERLPAGCAFAGQQSPTRSARPLIALSSKPRTCPSTAKPRTICTYTTQESNPCGICTSIFVGLKVIQNQHLQQSSTTQDLFVLFVAPGFSPASGLCFCTLTKSPLRLAKVCRPAAECHGHQEPSGSTKVELLRLRKLGVYPSRRSPSHRRIPNSAPIQSPNWYALNSCRMCTCRKRGRGPPAKVYPQDELFPAKKTIHPLRHPTP